MYQQDINQQDIIKFTQANNRYNGVHKEVKLAYIPVTSKLL